MKKLKIEYCDACKAKIRAYHQERRKNPEIKKRNREYMREYRRRKKEKNGQG